MIIFTWSMTVARGSSMRTVSGISNGNLESEIRSLMDAGWHVRDIYQTAN